jgi:sporulation protein YlmC with PRC-barrel domain
MFKKSVDIISRKISNLERTENVSSYFGKKVYSKTGGLIGVVYDVILKKGVMIGILVRGKRKTFIGKEFFGSQSKEGIILKIEPVTSIIGKQVYDSDGKRIGKVIGLNRRSCTNAYSDILVKKSIIRRAFSIPKKDIDMAKKSVLLKKPYLHKSKKKKKSAKNIRK